MGRMGGFLVASSWGSRDRDGDKVGGKKERKGLGNDVWLYDVVGLSRWTTDLMRNVDLLLDSGSGL